MMKFSAKWHSALKHEKDFNELIIKFKEDKFPQLISFLKKHQYQRIVISIEDISDKRFTLSAFQDVKNRYKCNNFALRLPDYYVSDQDDVAQFCKSQNIDFFYNTVANDFSQLNGLIAAGVSDVLIGNDLGFYLPQVKNIATESGVLVRAYPNIAQSTWAATPIEKKFFIRPEIALAYSEFIDIYEFFQLPDNELSNPDVLYDVYALQGEWSGDLSELILNFNASIDSRCFSSDADLMRAKCGKRCFKKESGCKICESAFELAKAMKENKYFFNSEKG